MGFQILLSSGEMNRSSVEQVLSVNEDDIGVFAEAVALSTISRAGACRCRR